MASNKGDTYARYTMSYVTILRNWCRAIHLMEGMTTLVTPGRKTPMSPSA
jgi:hypothetical protein